MPRLIIVAGPSRGGKSKFAAEYAERHDLPLVSTDDFKDLPWADVPFAVGEAVDKFDDTVVVDGVRALSFVKKLGRAKDVVAIFWCVAGPCDNAKAKGLETRQRVLLTEMRGELPDLERVDEQNWQWIMDGKHREPDQTDMRPVIMIPSRVNEYDVTAEILAQTTFSSPELIKAIRDNNPIVPIESDGPAIAGDYKLTDGES